MEDRKYLVNACIQETFLGKAGGGSKQPPVPERG